VTGVKSVNKISTVYIHKQLFIVLYFFVEEGVSMRVKLLIF
jgi:hypothetical protein